MSGEVTRGETARGTIAYVVATFTPGTGGFEWFLNEASALAFYKAEVFEMRKHARGCYVPIYIGAVQVPPEVRKLAEITAWLDGAGQDFWNIPTCEEDTK